MVNRTDRKNPNPLNPWAEVRLAGVPVHVEMHDGRGLAPSHLVFSFPSCDFVVEAPSELV